MCTVVMKLKEKTPTYDNAMTTLQGDTFYFRAISFSFALKSSKSEEVEHFAALTCSKFNAMKYNTNMNMKQYLVRRALLPLVFSIHKGINY